MALGRRALHHAGRVDGATEAQLTWLGVSSELAGSHGRLAVVDLGGDYPDVVQLLQQAKQSGALPSRFRVNAGALAPTTNP